MILANIAKITKITSIIVKIFAAIVGLPYFIIINTKTIIEMITTGTIAALAISKIRIFNDNNNRSKTVNSFVIRLYFLIFTDFSLIEKI